jgi:hypothetical protein
MPFNVTRWADTATPGAGNEPVVERHETPTGSRLSAQGGAKSRRNRVRHTTLVEDAPSAEYFTVKDGKIVHSLLIFDRTPFDAARRRAT